MDERDQESGTGRNCWLEDLGAGEGAWLCGRTGCISCGSEQRHPDEQDWNGEVVNVNGCDKSGKRHGMFVQTLKKSERSEDEKGEAGAFSSSKKTPKNAFAHKTTMMPSQLKG